MDFIEAINKINQYDSTSDVSLKDYIHNGDNSLFARHKDDDTVEIFINHSYSTICISKKSIFAIGGSIAIERVDTGWNFENFENILVVTLPKKIEEYCRPFSRLEYAEKDLFKVIKNNKVKMYNDNWSIFLSTNGDKWVKFSTKYLYGTLNKIKNSKELVENIEEYRNLCSTGFVGFTIFGKQKGLYG
jgi:hypothetical protein